MNFADMLRAARSGADGFALGIPENWHQGRTAYGGLSAALALAAARRAGGEELAPLRSATVNFVGPVFGEVEARARVLRRGKNATWIDAELTRAGEVVLTASFVFMRAVDSALDLVERGAPAGIVPVEEARPFAMTHSPVFLRSHFDVRFALPREEGPRRAEKRPDICWWVRLKEPEGIDPLTAMLLIADALPPGVLPLLHPGVPVSSMTWIANFLTPEPATRDGWWLMRDAGEYARGGCASERLDIWNMDGAPIVSGMQSVAVFG